MSYRGFCIGGPAAGQHWACLSPKLVIEEAPVNRIYTKPFDPASLIEPVRHNYRHEQIAGHGLWVHETLRDTTEMLGLMLTAYLNTVPK